MAWVLEGALVPCSAPCAFPCALLYMQRTACMAGLLHILGTLGPGRLPRFRQDLTRHEWQVCAPFVRHSCSDVHDALTEFLDREKHVHSCMSYVATDNGRKANTACRQSSDWVLSNGLRWLSLFCMMHAGLPDALCL